MKYKKKKARYSSNPCALPDLHFQWFPRPEASNVTRIMSIVCFVSSSVSISNHRLSGEVEGLCGFIEVDWGSIERSQTHIGEQECNPLRADVTDYKEEYLHW